MDLGLTLQLCDIRLLQTLRLLEAAMEDHPDQEEIRDVLRAIRSGRDKLSHLVTQSDLRDDCCA